MIKAEGLNPENLFYGDSSQANNVVELNPILLAQGEGAVLEPRAAISMYIQEIAGSKHPETEEQFSLGKSIQEAKLLLYALNGLDRTAFPFWFSDKLDEVLDTQVVKGTMLRYFEPSKTGKKETEKSNDDFPSLFVLGDDLQGKIQREIEMILDRNPESVDESLESFLEEKLNIISEGTDSLKRLIESNLKLVIKIAKRLRRDWDEYIADGNEGLMIAASYYDYRRGFRFSTYATPWISQVITRGVANTSRMIRIPVHLQEQLNKNGDEDDEREVDEHIQAARRTENVLSLDYPLDNSEGENDTTFGDFIEDVQDRDIVDQANLRIMKGLVGEILADLPQREQTILIMRYGLDGNRAHTLEEVGKVIGVTRERVRQVELKTLGEIRKHKKASHLKSTWDD